MRTLFDPHQTDDEKRQEGESIEQWYADKAARKQALRDAELKANDWKNRERKGLPPENAQGPIVK
jgi:hypothetical protein